MDLKEFATQVLSTCDEDAFSARGLVFRVNPGKPTLLVDALLTIDDRASAAIREQLKGRHDFLSFASKTDWAPEVGAEMRPAWIVVIVGRRIDPLFLVKSIGAGHDWIRLSRHEIPGWAASTAKLLAGLDGKAFPQLRVSQ